jgi:hypothetical protein
MSTLAKWLIDIFSRPEMAPTDVMLPKSGSLSATRHNNSNNDDDDNNNVHNNIGSTTKSMSSSAAAVEGGNDSSEDDDDDSDLFVYSDNHVLDEKRFQYMEIEPGEAFAVRSANSHKWFYLVTTDHVVFKWCVLLAHEQAHREGKAHKAKPVDAMNGRPRSIPGVVGAFISLATSTERPVFQFEEPNGLNFLLESNAQVIDAGVGLSSVLLAERTRIDGDDVHLSHFNREGRTDGSNIADRIDSQHRQQRQQQQPQQKSVSQQTGDTPVTMVANGDSVTIDLRSKSSDATADTTHPSSAMEEVELPDQWSGVSPVNRIDGKKWVAIGSSHWHLYKAFEEMHYRSGCYLISQKEAGIALPANARTEFVRYQNIFRLERSIELLIKQMSHQDTTDADRLTMIQRASEMVSQLDVYRMAQATRAIKN